MQDGIGTDARSGDGHNVYCKTKQARIEDRMIGQAQHQSSPQPDREYCELDGGSNADQVAAAGIIRRGQARCYADDRGDGQAAQGTLETRERYRAALDQRDDSASGNSQDGARGKGPRALEEEATVPAPQAKADGEHLGKERQEKRRDDDGNRVVIDNTCREKYPPANARPT